MSVKIRLKRVGARNSPVYRVVVTHKTSPRDGRFIEEIGTYDPCKATDNFKVDLNRMQHWLGVGAQPSDTVRTLLKKVQKAAAAQKS